MHTNHSPHTEVPIRVTAWVDSAVAPLVTALSAFSDAVITIDSCEGYDGEPARVSFTSHASTCELVALVQRLAGVFSARLHSEDVTLRLEWHAGAEQPVADLLVDRECLRRAVDALLAA